MESVDRVPEVGSTNVVARTVDASKKPRWRVQVMNRSMDEGTV